MKPLSCPCCSHLSPYAQWYETSSNKYWHCPICHNTMTKEEMEEENDIELP